MLTPDRGWNSREITGDEYMAQQREWLQRILHHTRRRAHYLFCETAYDPIEVGMVIALWLNIAHHMFWEAQGEHPDVYRGILLVAPDAVLTPVMLGLGCLGFSACMLWLMPRTRRIVDLVLATYFVVNSAVLLAVRHDSLLAMYGIVLFGMGGLWTYWRQGQGEGLGSKTNDYRGVH